LSNGRPPKNVEFLRILHELSGLKQREFSRKTETAQPDMSSYLSSKKVPGVKVLQRCVRSLAEWDVAPRMEVEPIPHRLSELPQEGGVYILYDSAGNVLYIGKATNFRAEVQQTLSRTIPVPIRFGPDLAKTSPHLKKIATHISLYAVPSPRLRHNLEALLLRVFPNQTHNTNIGHFW
jgi:hypothetical protein